MADAESALLVVGPAWVGDMVMAQSLFKILKQQQPNRAIDVLAPDWTCPLLARMPEVRTAVSLPLGHGELRLGVRYRLARGLRERRYEQAIVLPNSLKSALVPFWSNIPRRTGYRGEQRWGLLNDIRTLDKTVFRMTVQRFNALASPEDKLLPPPIPEPRLAIDPANRAAALDRLGLNQPDTPVLALCPGAEYGPAKRWPVEHFAQVAKTKLAQGWSVWLFGSAKDAEVAAEIRRQPGTTACVDLTGKTGLGEAIDLLSMADVVLSNDSGLMHVAAALGCKLIALYGSSDPGFTPPLSDRAQVLRLGLECSPCFARDCPLGHFKCLRDLSPQRVLALMPPLPESCQSSSATRQAPSDAPTHHRHPPPR